MTSSILIKWTESRYTFEGHSRLSYGWENPNHAGAALVCLLPVLWAWSIHLSAVGSRPKRMLTLALELLLCILIALTYSRGACTGWIISLLFVCSSSRRLVHSVVLPARTLAVFFATRAAVIAVTFAATGVGQRFAGAASGDASVINRYSLWVGAIKLIFVSPLRGWGKGMSGLSYMQWIQEPASKLTHGGTVNTYLHAGVEFGLPALSALLFFVFFGVFRSCSVNITERFLSKIMIVGFGGGIVAFAVACIFNTLYLNMTVTWIPISLLGLIMINTEWGPLHYYLPRSVGHSLLASTVASLFVYASGFLFWRKEHWRMERMSEGVVRYIKKDQSQGLIDLCFLPDLRTLGPYFGKEIRKAVSVSEGAVRSFSVFSNGKLPSAGTPGVILLGSRSEDSLAITSTRYCAVFPGHLPTPNLNLIPPIFLVVPELDQLGYTAQWISWTSEASHRVQIVDGLGQDVRSIWPDVLAQCVQELSK